MEPRFPVTLSTPVGMLASRQVVVVGPDEPATGVRRRFRDLRARIALVVDRDGRLLGVIARGDVLIISSRKSNARARDIMQDPRIVLDSDESVGRAVERMLKLDEWYAPVVDRGGRVIGVFGLEYAIQRMLDENENYLRSIRVGDVMTRDVEAVREDDFVSSVWERMVERRYAGFPVVDSKGRLVGIVTQYDILLRGGVIARETAGGPSRGSRIREIMTRSVSYAYPADPLEKPARLMAERGFGRIPVIEGGTRRLVGIVDREDVVKLLLE